MTSEHKFFQVHLPDNAAWIRRQGSHSQYRSTIDYRGNVMRQGGCYFTTLPRECAARILIGERKPVEMIPNRAR